jgi:hypothetical protein
MKNIVQLHMHGLLDMSSPDLKMSKFQKHIHRVRLPAQALTVMRDSVIAISFSPPQVIVITQVTT